MGIKRCTFTPRILTRAESKRFVQVCCEFPDSYNSPLRGTVMGTALLILFLAGLRAGEVIRLTIQDVDLFSGILHIRNTKFGKSRYVPVSDDIKDRLRLCRDKIARRLGERSPDDAFFCTSKGMPYTVCALREAFYQARARAKINCSGKSDRFRMHDLRHNAAVLRMLLWYEEGVDLEARLPILATYLGHKNLISTQKYLHLTEELLIPIMTRYQSRFGHIIDDGGMP
jgi:integrase